MIDYSKPVQTEDGRRVELLTIKGRGKFPIVGYVGDNKRVDSWTADGKYFGDWRESDCNLMNVPPEAGKL